MEDKDVLSVSIFQIVVPRIRNFLLFLYREGVIASGIFWGVVCVSILVILASPTRLGFDGMLFGLFLSGIYYYHFAFVKYIIYISVVMCVISCIGEGKEESKRLFYKSVVKYAIIIVVSFLLLPAYQSA